LADDSDSNTWSPFRDQAAADGDVGGRQTGNGDRAERPQNFLYRGRHQLCLSAQPLLGGRLGGEMPRRHRQHARHEQTVVVSLDDVPVLMNAS